METGSSPSRSSDTSASSPSTASTATAAANPSQSSFGDLNTLLATLPSQLELKPCLSQLMCQSSTNKPFSLSPFLLIVAKQTLPNALRFGPYSAKLAKQSTTEAHWKVSVFKKLYCCQYIKDSRNVKPFFYALFLIILSNWLYIC